MFIIGEELVFLGLHKALFFDSSSLLLTLCNFSNLNAVAINVKKISFLVATSVRTLTTTEVSLVVSVALVNKEVTLVIVLASHIFTFGILGHEFIC